MVNIAKRMRAFQPLYNIRHGRGASVLPPPPAAQVAKFNIVLPNLPKTPESYAAIRGTKIFIKELLPRLKYHNPTLPISVQSVGEQPSLELTFASNQHGILSAIESQAKSSDPAQVQARWSDIETSDSPAAETSTPKSSQSSYQRVLSANLSGHQVETIWDFVQGVTGAKEAPAPTTEELEQMQRLNEFFEQSEKDRQLVKAGRDAIAKEKAELRKAKEAAERMSAEF
ncbi:hypothetical protein B0A52_00397 [Exophiala mesophila]|uniref:Uncharacterized protein n=1 Tax=Exophiala mesophila TaxID=212818 RepID=A0A438NJW8_EXOME|nr:hypothetical protein B0A52_00397 [Exophiala mesophila]